MKARLTSFALALALVGALLMLPGSAIAQTTHQVVDIPVAGKFPGGTLTGTLDILKFYCPERATGGHGGTQWHTGEKEWQYRRECYERVSLDPRNRLSARSRSLHDP